MVPADKYKQRNPINAVYDDKKGVVKFAVNPSDKLDANKNQQDVGRAVNVPRVGHQFKINPTRFNVNARNPEESHLKKISEIKTPESPVEVEAGAKPALNLPLMNAGQKLKTPATFQVNPHGGGVLHKYTPSIYNESTEAAPPSHLPKHTYELVDKANRPIGGDHQDADTPISTPRPPQGNAPAKLGHYTPAPIGTPQGRLAKLNAQLGQVVVEPGKQPKPGVRPAPTGLVKIKPGILQHDVNQPDGNPIPPISTVSVVQPAGARRPMGFVTIQGADVPPAGQPSNQDYVKMTLDNKNAQYSHTAPRLSLVHNPVNPNNPHDNNVVDIPPAGQPSTLSSSRLPTSRPSTPTPPHTNRPQLSISSPQDLTIPPAPPAPPANPNPNTNTSPVNTTPANRPDNKSIASRISQSFAERNGLPPSAIATNPSIPSRLNTLNRPAGRPGTHDVAGPIPLIPQPEAKPTFMNETIQGAELRNKIPQTKDIPGLGKMPMTPRGQHIDYQ